MERHDPVGGFILAGGASSRMGRDKALLEFAGVPLLVRTARLLDSRVAQVTVIGPPERYAALGLRVVPDDQPGVGPLGGMATALRLSTADWNLLVSCDLPYLTGEWIDWLIGRALASEADALVPETERGLEPLCATYRRRCGPVLAAALARGVRKVTDAVAGLVLEKVTRAQWKPFDLDGALFHNMNTPEDYDEARAQLEPEAPR